MWLAEALWDARLSPWRRLARRRREAERRLALETAAGLMRASVDARPRARPPGLPPGRAAVPALRDADPVVGAGRRQPHRVLVPGVPGRRRAARRVTCPRVRSARTAPLRVPARVLPRGVRGRARRAGAVRVRGARDARRAVALRVPAARARLRRGAGADAAPAARRAQRDRRSAARAGRRDLRARALRASATRGDDALFRSILLPMLTVDGRALRRLRLARRRVRRRVRRLRADALRHGADVCRARAASSGSPPGSDVELGGGIRCAPSSPGEISQLWPEARGLMPPEFGRDVDRLLVLELARELDAADAEPPDAAAELADAVTALRLATAGAIAAGPVVFERLDFRPLRDLAAPADRGDAAARRGDPARQDPRRGSPPTCASGSPLADDDRELGEALDRWELSLFSEEPFRSAQVREALTCLLGERRRRVGRGDARRRCCSARRRGDRAELLEALRAERARPRRARRRAARARRDAPARQPRRRSSTRARRDAARPAAAAGARPARRLSSAGRVAPVTTFGAEAAQTRDARAGYGRCDGRSGRTGCWRGSSGSSGSSGRRARRAAAGRAARRVAGARRARPRRGRASRATRGPRVGCRRNFERRRKE